MMCYLLNKYNAPKTVMLCGWGFMSDYFMPKDAKVTIKTLMDEEGPLDTPNPHELRKNDEVYNKWVADNWVKQWEGHWGKVETERKWETRRRTEMRGGERRKGRGKRRGTMVRWYHVRMAPWYHGTMVKWYHVTMLTSWYHANIMVRVKQKMVPC